MQSKALSSRGRRASAWPADRLHRHVAVADEGADLLLPARLPVDHEQVLDRLLHDGAKARERRAELLLVGGLRDEAHGSLAQAPLELLGRGDQEDGDVAHLGVVLQAVEQPPAVEVGQAHVERDGVGPELPGGAEPVRPPGGDHDLEPVLAAEVGQDLGEGRVVLDHEEHSVARLDLRPVVGQGGESHVPGDGVGARGERSAGTASTGSSGR